jgi:hypothetical protein
MTRQFVHDQRAVRVVFRRGALDAVGDEVDRLGAQRVLLIGSPATPTGWARCSASE